MDYLSHIYTSQVKCSSDLRNTLDVSRLNPDWFGVNVGEFQSHAGRIQVVYIKVPKSCR